MVTECSMADNVAAEAPNVEFVRPCNLCPHMKRITLPKILDSLVNMREEVLIDPAIAERGAAADRAHDRAEELTRTPRSQPRRAPPPRRPSPQGAEERHHDCTHPDRRRRPRRPVLRAQARARIPSRCSPPLRSGRGLPRAGRRAVSQRRCRRATARRSIRPTPWSPAPASSTRRWSSAWRGRRATVSATCSAIGVPFDK